MATATTTVTVNPYPNGKDQTLRHFVLLGSVAVQASPATYATNGLPISFVTPETYVGPDYINPVWCVFTGIAGFVYVYDAGHKTVRIFESAGAAGALAELANASPIPAGVSGDTIKFKAEFIRAE